MEKGFGPEAAVGNGEFTFIFLDVASVASMLVIFVLASASVKKRNGQSFLFLTATLLVWATGSLAEGLAEGLAAKLFWRDFTQFGTFLSPLGLAWFAAEYTAISRKGIRYFLGLAAFIQTLAIFLILTDQSHHLMRTGVELLPSREGIQLVVHKTIAGKAFVAFNFALAAFAELLLGIFLVKVPRDRRSQVFSILLGTLIPAGCGFLICALLDYFHIPIPISVFFIPACLVVRRGILKHGLLALSPIARDTIFDCIDAGILVLTSEGSIVDSNPAGKTMLVALGSRNPDAPEALLSLLPREARSMFIQEDSPFTADRNRTKTFECGGTGKRRVFHLTGSPAKDPAGSPGTLNEVPEGGLPAGSRVGVLAGLEAGQSQGSYELSLYPLCSGQALIGTLVVIRDDSERSAYEKMLLLRAERDRVTGALNRETFVERAGALIASVPTTASGLPVDTGYMALILVDIDYFKGLNDRYGHGEGDRVLGRFCRFLASLTEEQDILGRIEGDEFALLCRRKSQEEVHGLARSLKEKTAREDLGSHSRYQVPDSGDSMSFASGGSMSRVATRTIEKPAQGGDARENTLFSARPGVEESVFGPVSHADSIHLSVSIGVAFSERDGADNFEMLHSRADRALARAKSRGRNTIVYSDSVSL